MPGNEVRVRFRADTKEVDAATGRLGAALGKVNDKLKAFRLPLAAASGAISGLGLASIKMASDAEESVNAVNVVFGSASGQILDFGKSASRSVGLSRTEFNGLAVSAGTLLKATGQSMEEVSQNTIMLTERASDLASVFNTDVESAMSAINQALRGETEAIRRFGGDVTDATLQQMLLAQGSDALVTSLTSQEKTLLRMQAIMQQTSQVQGDFANTSDGLANSQRIMMAEMKNVGIELGTALLPAATKVAQMLSKLVQVFADMPGPMRTGILIAGGATVALAAIGLAIPPVIAGVGLLAGAMGALSLSMLPITAIVLGITAAVVAGIIIWKNWDTISEKLISTFQRVKEVFGTVANALLSLYESNFGWLLPAGPLIKGLLFVRDHWETIWNAISNVTNAIWKAIKGTVQAGVNFVRSKIDALMSKVRAVLALIAQIPGAGAIGGAISGGVQAIIPGFADGGVVPGPRGSPQLAMVHGGETILPTHRGGGFSEEIHIHNDFTGATILGIDDLDATIQQSVDRGMRRARRPGRR